MHQTDALVDMSMSKHAEDLETGYHQGNAQKGHLTWGGKKHRAMQMAKDVLSSKPLLAAADAGFRSVTMDEQLMTRAHAVMSRVASSSNLSKPQAMVEQVHLELVREGIMAHIVEVAKSMAKAYNVQVGEAGAPWFELDSFIVGFGLGATAAAPLSPTAQALFYVPVCMVDRCLYEYGDGTTTIARFGAKTCVSVLGGAAPFPSNVKGWFAHAHHSIEPVLLVGAGTFALSSDMFLEFGGGMEIDYGIGTQLEGFIKVMPSFRRMKAVMFEVTSPILNVVQWKYPILEREDDDDEPSEGDADDTHADSAEEDEENHTGEKRIEAWPAIFAGTGWCSRLLISEGGSVSERR